MLTVLGGLAEFERELIHARTGEGRERAKDRGVRLGRPTKLTLHQRQEALKRLAAGETQADIACTLRSERHDDWATTERRLASEGNYRRPLALFRPDQRRSWGPFERAIARRWPDHAATRVPGGGCPTRPGCRLEM